MKIPLHHSSLGNRNMLAKNNPPASIRTAIESPDPFMEGAFKNTLGTGFDTTAGIRGDGKVASA
ncbi:MAG TPA: hypothetical protein VK731_06290 [Candidatus Cybelea sp.]|jgi:hypothetical protein|nr:hypothetical protein [Candidatus Cybelea sp.]